MLKRDVFSSTDPDSYVNIKRHYIGNVDFLYNNEVFKRQNKKKLYIH